MDKVIKHRFWILLALVPPLVIFGYYSANGAIQEAITKRTGELETSFKGIPQGTGPNPKFVKEEFNGLDVYNQTLRKLVDAEMTRVWTDQLPRMTWPDSMQTFVPKTPRGTMMYRGEFPRQAAFTYKAGYADQIEKLYESIEPLKMELDGKITGKVRLDRASVPIHGFPPMLVPSEQLWDAQEDIWLLQLLFDAVRNVNRPAENAAKSAVRWVYGVNLVGGTGESILVATAGMGGSGGGMLRRGGDEDEVAGAGMAGLGMNPAMMGPGGFGGGAVQTSVSFNPAEEFGIGTEAAAAMPGGGVGSGNGGLAGDEQLAIARGASAGGGMGMGFGGGIPIRYIAFDETKKFRERGFYMSVLIDQKKIADFLIELSNAEWPIRIVRFNVGANAGGAGRPGGGGMMMAGGMGMGNMGGVMDDDDRHDRRGGGGNAMFSGMPPAMMSGGGMGFAAGTNPFGGSMGGGLGGDPDADYAPAGGLLSGGFGAMGAGGIGPQSMMSNDQIANLFTHPDLVQMDLCGVITIYNPPAGESGEGAAAAAADAASADASATPAADAATPAGDAAAPEGEATTPATEGTEPAVDGATPATDGSVPTTEPAVESQPTEPASDAPSAESASGAEPAAEPPATEPAADTPGDAAPAPERAPGN